MRRGLSVQEELGALDRNKVYVVGGIVDRTPKKGLSKAKAAELQVAAARLPLGLLAGVKAKHLILNVDTVVAALAAWHSSGGDWAVALERVLPQRHLNQGRGNTGSKKRKPEDCFSSEDGDDNASDADN
jgi:tRNA (guanine9-N1)-methyltransferase